MLEPGRNRLRFMVTPLKRGLYSLKHISAHLDHLQLVIPLRTQPSSRTESEQGGDDDAELLSPQVCCLQPCAHTRLSAVSWLAESNKVHIPDHASMPHVIDPSCAFPDL